MRLKNGTLFKQNRFIDWPTFPLVLCIICGFTVHVCILERVNTAQRRQSCMQMKYNREKRGSPAERRWQSDAEAARQRPWLFSEMNINNITSHNGSTEIREITSIVPPSPTDTNRSAEERIRRMEEHNLAAHHAPLFKVHNGLWSSVMPFKWVLCCDVQML